MKVGALGGGIIVPTHTQLVYLLVYMRNNSKSYRRIMIKSSGEVHIGLAYNW